MTIDIHDLTSYTEGQHLILFTVTKDTVNFLRLYKEKQPNFTIKAIIDVSMDVRPTVKALIDETRGDIPLYTDLTVFDDIVEDGDLIIQFESLTYHKRLEAQIEQFDCNKWNTAEFKPKIEEIYRHYIDVEGGYEWNFAMHHKYYAFLNTWILLYHNVRFMTSVNQFAYIGTMLNSSMDDEVQCQKIDDNLYNMFPYDALDFTADSLSISIYEYCYKKVRDQRVHFVFSTDFAGGKFNYIFKNHYRMLIPNLWVAVIDPSSYYDASNVPAISIHKALVQREYMEGHDTDIYVKMEGSLLTYTYNFLLEGNLSPDLQHIFSFFHDYVVEIIHKDTETQEELQPLIAEFCKMHYIDPTRVKLITNHNNSEYFTIDQ